LRASTTSRAAIGMDRANDFCGERRTHVMENPVSGNWRGTAANPQRSTPLPYYSK
jgi:hypothetical protein